MAEKKSVVPKSVQMEWEIKMPYGNFSHKSTSTKNPDNLSAEELDAIRESCRYQCVPYKGTLYNASRRVVKDKISERGGLIEEGSAEITTECRRVDSKNLQIREITITRKDGNPLTKRPIKTICPMEEEGRIKVGRRKRRW